MVRYLFALALLSVSAQAQSPDSATLKALLEEVHKLRIALETSSLVVPRAQLTLQMVSLQQQKVARVEQQLHTVRQQIAEDSGQRQHASEVLDRAAQQLSTATDPAARRELEREQTSARKFLADQTSLVELRGREGALIAELQREQNTLGDLTAKLNVLERSLSQ